jgi:rRNA maturation endonuclease Nob1
MSNNDEITREAVDKMKICLQCEHFFKPTKQCKKCGCFMPVKVRIPGMRCPVRKW